MILEKQLLVAGLAMVLHLGAACVVRAGGTPVSSIQDGDWADANTWDSGLPDSRRATTVNHIVNVTTAGLSAASLDVGRTNDSEVRIEAADLTVTDWIYLGVGLPGSLRLTGGAIVSNQCRVGSTAKGALLVQGGSFTTGGITRGLSVGTFGVSGTMRILGGAATITTSVSGMGSNALDFGELALLEIEPTANGAAGLSPINVPVGNVQLDPGGGAGLRLNTAAYAPAVGDSWDVITYTGTLAGSFGNLIAPPGYTIEQDLGTPGVVRITVTSVPPAPIIVDWILVGNPGNGSDPLNNGAVPSIGKVGYVYRIAKHEVTNDQYAKFLNAIAATDPNGAYHLAMGSNARGGISRSGDPGSYTYAARPNMGNKPVNFVSFFSAMRFVNWLHNGQPFGDQSPGTTEDGVYAISDGLSETRAPGAKFFIPTENEWYKAAYHHPAAQGGDVDDYWLYPTRSNSPPTQATADSVGDSSNPGSNVANDDRSADWNGQDGNVTTVGSAGSPSESHYGTRDQGGNLWEWNEAVVLVEYRGIRGGSWEFSDNPLKSSLRNGFEPFEPDVSLGFRVASPATTDDIPAVSQWGAFVLILLTLTAGTLIHARRGGPALVTSHSP